MMDTKNIICVVALSGVYVITTLVAATKITQTISTTVWGLQYQLTDVKNQLKAIQHHDDWVLKNVLDKRS